MSHKPLSLIFIAALLFQGLAFGENPDLSSWQTQKSEHFIIYYHDAPQTYLEDLVNYSEKYYNSITDELGFTRFEGFWTWDKRAKIFLYKDAKEYQDMTKHPQWSGAGVNIYSREVSTYVNMNHFFDAILPHELGHIIFREFVGFDTRLPLWMDEGVVSYLEKEHIAMRLRMTRALVRTGNFMTVEELTDIRSLDKFVMPDIFYSEASSLIVFLIDEYGKDKFVSFCQRLRELKQGETWLDAMKDMYGFKDLADLNENWVVFLKK